ncbi:hypothetical protein [Kutzneria sp. CA-103260]|uniref:hypothetical protein n=1 Tax=Kutzneria sp. CA-103260 TaxID=2802641 RepID=UPI001BAE1151|nr:hypothetical protein [Kutzneria sp. CA-103260]
MAGPFLFVATNKVRDGRLADERRRAPEWARLIQEREPRLIGFHEYVSADGSEVEFVQIHPDAASFEHHMRLLADQPYGGNLDGVTSIRIYGQPTPAILEMLERAAGPDVSVTVLSEHLGGFTRA